MRASSLALTAALVITTNVSRAQSVHATSSVITVLPEPIIKTLVGCWREKGEPDRWNFRRKGTSGIEVIHETDTPTSASDLMFDPAANDYAFVATGWRYPQLLIFVIRAHAIEVWFYSSHHSRGYHWTGRHALFGRCPRA